MWTSPNSSAQQPPMVSGCCTEHNYMLILYILHILVYLIYLCYVLYIACVYILYCFLASFQSSRATVSSCVAQGQ